MIESMQNSVTERQSPPSSPLKLLMLIKLWQSLSTNFQTSPLFSLVTRRVTDAEKLEKKGASTDSSPGSLEPVATSLRQRRLSFFIFIILAWGVMSLLLLAPLSTPPPLPLPCLRRLRPSPLSRQRILVPQQSSGSWGRQPQRAGAALLLASPCSCPEMAGGPSGEESPCLGAHSGIRFPVNKARCRCTHASITLSVTTTHSEKDS